MWKVDNFFNEVSVTISWQIIAYSNCHIKALIKFITISAEQIPNGATVKTATVYFIESRLDSGRAEVELLIQ